MGISESKDILELDALLKRMDASSIENIYLACFDCFGLKKFEEDVYDNWSNHGEAAILSTQAETISIYLIPPGYSGDHAYPEYVKDHLSIPKRYNHCIAVVICREKEQEI